MNPDRFITLEGGEGAGKSTCLAFIRDFLVNKGFPLVVTREPGGLLWRRKSGLCCWRGVKSASHQMLNCC